MWQLRSCVLSFALTGLISRVISFVNGDVKFQEVPSTEEIVRRINTFIEAGFDCHNNPGLAVAVVRGGEVIMAKGYGFKTIDKREPITNSTLFGTASLSKAFAATLILKLIEKTPEKLSLASPLHSILNDEKLFYGDLRSRYATLEDILSHRMGLPGNNQMRFDDTLTRESLTRRLRYLKPVGGFRTSYYYSNLMYGLATYIAEILGERSWEDLVQSEIFRPLEMTSSTFVTTANREEIDLVQGYLDRDGKLIPVPFDFSRHWGELCGSGCVLSSALDMANWMIFNLNGGKNRQGKQILTTAVLQEAFTPKNSMYSSYTKKFYSKPVIPVTLSFNNYGMGWKLGHYRGYPIISHSGSTYGYRALVTMIPDYEIGIFVALTGDDPSLKFRTNIHLYIADLLLGYKPWLNATTVCTFPQPWIEKENEKPETVMSKNLTAQRNLTEYTGLYHNEAYGTLNISVNESLNSLMMQYGIGKFILYPTESKDEFSAEGVDMLENIRKFSTLRFEAEETNSVVTALIAPSFESKLPPRFIRKDYFSKVTFGNVGYSVTFQAVYFIPVIILITAVGLF